MIVVDASVIVDALLLDGDALDRLSRASSSATDFAAPHVIDLEVVSALRRKVHKAQITEARAEAALAQMDSLPIDRANHSGLVPVIWALRHNFSAYDAAYIALAQTLNASLLTRDAKFAQAARTFTQVQLA